MPARGSTSGNATVGASLGRKSQETGQNISSNREAVTSASLGRKSQVFGHKND